MSPFLNEPQLDWRRPDVNELRDTLVLAYRGRDAAEQLADRVGLVPGTFPEQANMRATWTELLGETASQGKLEQLVQLAATDPTAAGFQPRLQDFLDEAPEIAPPQPPIEQPAFEAAVTITPERLLERRSRLMRIELAAAVTAAAPSVVKLSLSFGRERGHGTGFLISSDRVLTNHHNVMHETFGAVTGVTAEFDYEERFVGDRLVCKGKTDTIVGNPAHDWAVIELVRPVDRAVLKLGTPYDVGLDDSVVIIQHPAGAFKKFALEALGIHAVEADRIRYLADTQQGSSGSPVFNVQMHVIALHHAESEETVTVDGSEQVVWSNQGIAIQRVIDELTQHQIAFVTND